MRASTYNIPRFLHAYDETTDGGLILPRGMLGTVADLAAQEGSRPRLTPPGRAAPWRGGDATAPARAARPETLLAHS